MLGGLGDHVRHHVGPSGQRRPDHAVDGERIGLRAAGGEHDLARAGTDQARHLGAGAGQRRARGGTEGVRRGGVAEVAPQGGQQRLEDPGSTGSWRCSPGRSGGPAARGTPTARGAPLRSSSPGAPALRRAAVPPVSPSTTSAGRGVGGRRARRGPGPAVPAAPAAASGGAAAGAGRVASPLRADGRGPRPPPARSPSRS